MTSCIPSAPSMAHQRLVNGMNGSGGSVDEGAKLGKGVVGRAAALALAGGTRGKLCAVFGKKGV